jgi:hypothetical protein
MHAAPGPLFRSGDNGPAAFAASARIARGSHGPTKARPVTGPPSPGLATRESLSAFCRKIGRASAENCFQGGIGQLAALPAVVNRDGGHSDKNDRHLRVCLIDELRHGAEGIPDCA